MSQASRYECKGNLKFIYLYFCVILQIPLLLSNLKLFEMSKWIDLYKSLEEEKCFLKAHYIKAVFLIDHHL